MITLPTLRSVAVIVAVCLASSFALVAQQGPIFHRADLLWKEPFLATGKGRIVGVFEVGGFANIYHTEFVSKRVTMPINSDSAGFAEHATNVVSVICARGKKPSAKGMAPESKVQSYYLDQIESEAKVFSKLFTTQKFSVSNHSYGIGYGWRTNSTGKWLWYGANPQQGVDPFGAYLASSRTFDSVVYASNYVIPVVAAGNERGDVPKKDCTVTIQRPGFANNTYKYDPATSLAIYGPNGGVDGFDVLPPTATAKNVITVGSLKEDNVLSSFSSTGPTNDGRIKPDLVALGEDIVAAGSESNLNGYTTTQGTSFAAPAVAGVIAQLQQYFVRIHGVDMLPSTAKAVLIHTAIDQGPAGPDFKYGWGVIDAESAGYQIKNGFDDGGFSLNEFRLVQNVNQHFYVKAKRADRKLRITIAWSDPPATVTEGGAVEAAYKTDTMPKLVNDVDMWIDVKANGNVTELHRPWILNFKNPKALATRGRNFRDNVEQVVIDNPVVGKIYRVNVVTNGPLVGGEQLFSRCISNADLYLPPPENITATSSLMHTKEADQPQAFSVNISWQRVPEAAVYKLRYRKVGTALWIIKDDLKTNSTIINGIELATYEIQVMARRGPYTSLYTTIKKTFTVTPKVPTQCVAGKITPTSVTFSWVGDPNAQAYRVIYIPVDGSNTSKQENWSIANAVGTSVKVNGLASDGRYAWAVQSVYADNIKSEYSATQFFTLGNDCNTYESNNAIDMAKPIDVDRVLNARACANDVSDWYSFVVTPDRKNIRVILYQQPIAMKMSLYKRVNGNATLILESPDNADGLKTKYLTKNALDPGTYYLRVYKADPGQSAEGAPYPFTVSTKSVPY
ncbi:MAG: S8 family serine peptidase [Ignavibacteria bacterium]|nr:S8 family serine peptidase [Ignavibacteria bacterium]